MSAVFLDVTRDFGFYFNQEAYFRGIASWFEEANENSLDVLDGKNFGRTPNNSVYMTSNH